MRVKITLSLLCAIVLLGWSSAMSDPGTTLAKSQYVPNELIVCFRDSVPVPKHSLMAAELISAANTVLAQLSATHGLQAVERLVPDGLPQPNEALLTAGPPTPAGWPPTDEEIATIFHYYGLDRTFLLRFSRSIDPAQMAEQLTRAHADAIEYAEPNYIRQLDKTPNDPLYRLQWYLRVGPASARPDIESVEAWDITTGSSDVVIAVIDSGVAFSHADFANNKLLPGRNFTRTGPPEDDFGHGTAVAGTAAAVTDNTVNVAGVCWNCRVLPVKVCAPDGCFTSDAIRGISYAIASRVRVINLSFGGTAQSNSEFNALASANRSGILVSTSAGNGGEDFVGDNNDDIPHYPSSFSTSLENVVSVAASNRTRNLSGFSNFGRMSVNVAAPGEGIFTTVPTDTSLEISSGSGVRSLDGTSFSSPVVAGIAGLIYSQFPGTTVAQVRARLEGSVDRAAPFLDKMTSGGKVNAFRALESDEVAPAPISDVQVQAGSSPVALTWTATGDDNQQGQAVFYEIRYSRDPITADNFQQATKVKGAPFPQTAGMTETWTIQGVPSGMQYFAIRAIDNVGNSSISNSPVVQVN